MHRDQHEEGCVERCERFEKERNHYFTGKYMNKRDFQVEQDYFRSRYQLHNRLLHGWGIVCGLHVKRHWDPGCQDEWVIVTPGVAMDCCGREIVLEEETAVKIWDPPEVSEDDPAEQHDAAKQISSKKPIDITQDGEDPDQESESFLVCIHYCEEKIEYVPVLHGEGECDPSRREPNRIREGACLVVCDPDDVGPDCWRGTDDETDAEDCCRDDCGDGPPGSSGSCLDPDCPCAEYVPLALVTPRLDGRRYVIDKQDIDTKGRRQMALPGFMTHIDGINWPHGGTLTLSELQQMGGRLEVKFDRKLEKVPGADHEKRGINRHTFIVQYREADGDLEAVDLAAYDDYDDDMPNPGLAADRCTAVFIIDEDNIGAGRGRGRRRKGKQPRPRLENTTVYVTLYCDFVLDCHGNPVDGDHLRGLRPTGNGVEGGVFKSWFDIVADDWEEQEDHDVAS
jgi:hypothetical protein